MRRWADLSRPAPRPFTAIDWLLVALAAAIPSLLLVLFFAFVLWPHKAHAHEFYSAACCSDKDCGPVDSSRIMRVGADYVVDHRWRVPRQLTTPSPDGRFHGCWPDKDKPPICFYAPPDGF